MSFEGVLFGLIGLGIGYFIGRFKEELNNFFSSMRKKGFN